MGERNLIKQSVRSVMVRRSCREEDPMDTRIIVDNAGGSRLRMNSPTGGLDYPLPDPAELESDLLTLEMLEDFVKDENIEGVQIEKHPEDHEIDVEFSATARHWSRVLKTDYRGGYLRPTIW